MDENEEIEAVRNAVARISLAFNIAFRAPRQGRIIRRLLRQLVNVIYLKAQPTSCGRLQTNTTIIHPWRRMRTAPRFFILKASAQRLPLLWHPKVLGAFPKSEEPGVRGRRFTLRPNEESYLSWTGRFRGGLPFFSLFVLRFSACLRSTRQRCLRYVFCIQADDCERNRCRRVSLRFKYYHIDGSDLHILQQKGKPSEV